MTSFAKTAGPAGILIAVFATVTPDLKADQLNNAVREGQGVTAELGTNAAAITYWVSRSDGWHVVTTVDTVIEQNGDAEKHAVVRFSSVLLPGQSQLISVPLAIGKGQQACASVGSATKSRLRGLAAPHDNNAANTPPAKKDMKMKHSKALLLDYLARSVIRNVLHRYLRKMGCRTAVPALARGRASLHWPPRDHSTRAQAAQIYPNFAFAPDDTRILIETPDKTLAEYVGRGRAAATGRTAHHLFTGYLVAKAGEMKLLRESFNPLTMAQAQLANGVADIGPPGDEVHSF